MAKDKDKDKGQKAGNLIEGTLGDFKAVPGGRQKRIDVLVTVPFTRQNCEILAEMMDYKVRIVEAERPTLRPEFEEEIIGEIVEWKAANGAKKQGGIRQKELRVKLELSFSESVNHGLFQIAECDPPTLQLEQTQQELSLKAGGADSDEYEE